MITVTGLVVALVFLVDNVEADFFLIAASRPGKVLRLAPETYDIYTMAFDSPLQNPIAMDSDPENERIYWTELTGNDSSVIRQSSLHGGSVKTLVTTSGGISGLAVDATNDWIFYTDGLRKAVSKLTLSTLAQTTVISSGLERPHAIAVNTADRVIFWSNVGSEPKIERARYDGSDRKTLINKDITFVNAMVLDVSNDRLYWVDPVLRAVVGCDMEGKGRNTLLTVSSQRTLYGLALFNNSLYITDRGPNVENANVSALIRVDLENKGRAKLNSTSFPGLRLNGIHVYAGELTTELTTPPPTDPKGCGNSALRTAWSWTALFITVIIVTIITVC